jgi:hypothetical protein
MWLNAFVGAGLAIVYELANAISTGTSPANRAAYNAGEVIGGLILGLVECGLWAWMAAKVKIGRGWARIVSTVFFGFWCVGLISAIGQVTLGRAALNVSVIFVIALWIVGLGAIIALWQPESGRYFEATSAAEEMAAASRARSSGNQLRYGQVSDGQSGYGPPVRRGQQPEYWLPGLIQRDGDDQPPQ